MSDDDKKNLEQQLWNIADTLRGKMSADEFRNYILGFIFYKYLSEKMETYANEILKADGVSFQSIDETSGSGEELLEAVREEAIEKLGYFLNPSELFSVIAERGKSNTNNFILEDLTQILNNIERSTMGYESEDDFGNLFEDLDLTSSKLGKTESAKNKLISKVLSHLDDINFDLKNTESDVLGDAYEYLISQFAAGAGKKAGEFYTPQEVSTILAKIVTHGKSKLKSVYDPTCGSGSLLLRVAKEVDNSPNFYGQESNSTTYNLARMNMILHDVHYSKFNIQQDDTLEKPQHFDERFEAVVANPPFSAEWSKSELHLSDDRFSQYGVLAPKKKADFAFVQHMIHQLDENGIMAVIMPPGVLYRGSAEKQIRTYLIEDKNYLDAIIGLPSNIFYGTTIPTCILVFKKCREDSNNILFIDASNEFKKAKSKNFLTDKHVEKIVNVYKNRKIIDKFSHLASFEEIKKNKFNLNIARYIDAFKKTKNVDLTKVSGLLQSINKLSISNDELILSFCNELNLPFPEGNNLNLINKFRTGLMQKLFTREIYFQSENGNPYPDWKNMALKDIGKTYNGLTGKTKEDFGSGESYIQYMQIFSSTKINIEEFGQVKINENEEQNKAKFGDIFFTTSSETPMEVGYSSVLLNNSENLYLNSFCFGYRLNSFDIVNPHFAQYLFRSDKFRKKIRRLAQGSTRYNISKKELLEIKVDIPSEIEQIKIANFLSCIDKKIGQLDREIDEDSNSHIAQIDSIFE